MKEYPSTQSGLCSKSYVEVQHWLHSLLLCLITCTRLRPSRWGRTGPGGDTKGTESCQRPWLQIKKIDRSGALGTAQAME